MNIRRSICYVLIFLAFLAFQVDETDGIFIIKAAIIAKAIIAAKIIKGLAVANWFSRGGGGFGGFGGAGGSGGTGTGGFFFGKRRRDVETDRKNITNEDIEQLFSIVANIDEELCMARIICDIHANKEKKQFGELGEGIQKIFKNYNMTAARVNSPVLRYKQAAILGSVSDERVCDEVYSICRLGRDQIDRVVNTANNVSW